MGRTLTAEPTQRATPICSPNADRQQDRRVSAPAAAAITSFDLSAQGAIESAANARAFGPLPDGWEADVLPILFFFEPRGGR